MDMIMKFLDDMIHMTEGEQLIEYWWLWLVILFLFLLYVLYDSKKRKKE